MPETYTARAPGKLFIAGEYAVVTPGEPAVLVAVDRYLTVSATPAAGSGVTITSDAYGSPRTWERAHAAGDYLTAALATFEGYRRSLGLPERGYHLDVRSGLVREGRKLGLGSSGAVTVATIAVLAGLYGMDLDTRGRFRLALCAALAISPRGSGGDIAASTYGGWIRYTSPDRDRLVTALASRPVADVMADEGLWAGCTVTPLPPPPEPFIVGWTGVPADTDTLVAGAHARAEYPEFLPDSARAVDALTGALRAGEAAGVNAAIRAARAVLARFAEARGVVVETRALTALADIAEACGGAGKSSGAGGGDCGVAFAPAERVAQILEQWTTSGIIPLDLAAAEGDAA